MNQKIKNIKETPFHDDNIENLFLGVESSLSKQRCTYLT
jgi:hypothetical protein